MFDSQEVVWSDQAVSLFNAEVEKIRGLKYSEKVDKEFIFGAGNKAGGIGDGNITYDGSIKVLKGQLDLWQAAALAAGYPSITQIPAALVSGTVIYKAAYNRPLTGFNLLGIAFTELPYGWEQGAKMMELELPIMFLDLVPIV